MLLNVCDSVKPTSQVYRLSTGAKLSGTGALMAGAGKIWTLYELPAARPSASVAVKLKLKVPAAVGVPWQCPTLSIPVPVGIVPDEIDQVTGSTALSRLRIEQ